MVGFPLVATNRRCILGALVPPLSYPRPPIVEAVVEVGFSGGAPWEETETKLNATYRSEFSGKRQEVTSVQVQSRWTGSTFETSSRKDFLKWLLPDTSGRHLVGFGPAVLSRHVLAPYPGWAQFRPAVDKVFAQFCSVVQPQGVTNVGVRYIDQIVLPPEGRIGDFFQAIPPRLPSQPDVMTAFQITTESYDPESNTTSLLTLASGPPMAEGQRVVFYDLNLTCRFAEPVKLDSWSESVETLHARQRAIFEESITEKTRELFQ